MFSQAIDHFFQVPAHREIADHGLEEMHWLVLEDLETVLEVSTPGLLLALLIFA
jgi:hypothetical protein